MNTSVNNLLDRAGVKAAFKAYSEITGTKIEALMIEALQDFAEVSLGARMDALTAVPSDNVVSIEIGR